MKNICILFFLLILSPVSAQIKNVSFRHIPKAKQIEIRYEVTLSSTEKLSNIEVFAQIESGEFKRLENIEGNATSVYVTGPQRLYWNYEKEEGFADFEGNLKFKVEGKLIDLSKNTNSSSDSKQKSSKTHSLGDDPWFSMEYVTTGMTPYGFGFGFGSGNEFLTYFRFRSTFKGAYQYRHPSNFYGNDSDDMESALEYHNVTFGINGKLTKWLYMYGGLGYGYLADIYKKDDTYYYFNHYGGIHGMSGEIGLTLKMKWIGLSCGYGTLITENGFEANELILGFSIFLY